MDPQKIYEELNALDEWELTALEMNETDGKKIIQKLYGNNWRWSKEQYEAHTTALFANLYMQSEDYITFTRHPRFMTMEEHKHDFIELNYAYSGGFTQMIDGKKVPMQPGDVAILDTNVRHTIEMLPRETLVVNLLMKKDYFNEQLLARLSENSIITEFIISAIYRTGLSGRYLHFSPGENTRIRSFIHSIIAEIKHPSLGSREAISCYTVLLFTELMRSMRIEPTQEQKQSDRSLSISILALIQYINDHFMERSLTQIAGEFHIHPNYLTRLLKKHIGKGYMEMVNELRMERAVFLLKNTPLTINEIADESGFSNFNHFYKHFKKTHNITPKQYRKLVGH